MPRSKPRALNRTRVFSRTIIDHATVFSTKSKISIRPGYNTPGLETENWRRDFYFILFLASREFSRIDRATTRGTPRLYAAVIITDATGAVDVYMSDITVGQSTHRDAHVDADAAGVAV